MQALKKYLADKFIFKTPYCKFFKILELFFYKDIFPYNVINMNKLLYTNESKTF